VLLDIGTVFAGIGVAVVGFVVVVAVCVVILRLLAAILPSYEDRDAPEVSPEPDSSEEDPPSSPARVLDGTEELRE